MSLEKEMFQGVIWSAIEKYSGVAVSLLISAILARIISPQDFGVVAVASVLINFLQIFTDMGIGAAVIQRKDLVESELNSIFTISIGAGLFFSTIFFALSETVAHYYNNDALIAICRLLSLTLFFASLNIVPQAEMLKRKHFKLIARRTLTLQVISGVIAVYSAFNGAGIYALLISPVLTAIGMFMFNIYYYPRKIDWTFDVAPLKKIFSFSVYQFLFSFMNFFSRNIDQLIIGRYFSLRDLGYYDKAYKLMMLPLQNITNVITPVMQPILSNFQDDRKELANKYNFIIKLVSTISFPLSVVLYFTGGEMIRIVYGHNWDPAIPIFKVFAISLSMQMILSTSGAIYQSANATKQMFFNGISNTFVTVSGYLIAAFFFRNLLAMAWAWNITLGINMIVSYTILYKAVLGSSLGTMLRPLAIPLLCAVVLACFLSLFDNFIHLPDLGSASLKLFSALVIVLFIIQISNHYNLIKIVKAIK